MKRIELILNDGTADGAQKFSIGSETTIGYKIPRNCISKELSGRFFDNLKQPGVYVLVGIRSAAANKDKCVYIGQSDNIAKRLYEHKGGQDGEKQNGKMFWSECMAFVTSDSQLQKGHAEYLEYVFYKKAHEACRYILENDNTPSEKMVSEGDQIFCDDFVEDCHLLLQLMGHPIFVPPSKDYESRVYGKTNKLIIDNSARRGYAEPKYVKSMGYICKTAEIENGFMMLENSIISSDVSKKASASLKKLRRDLIKRGYVVEEDNKLIFKKEYLFNSAGIAASVVLGRNASSNEWKQE